LFTPKAAVSSGSAASMGKGAENSIKKTGARLN
jgi:hypothetical protein